MKPTLATYGALVLAIALEVAATSLLLHTRQFTRLGPTLASVSMYVGALYLISTVLQTMPVAVVYAVWSGVGIVLIAGVGLVAYGQRPDLPAVVGIGLILSGILVVHLFSHARV